MTIEKGDLVKLKQGGPLMYVLNGNNPEAIKCSWSAGHDKLDKTGVFHSYNLKIVDKQTKLKLTKPLRERMS